MRKIIPFLFLAIMFILNCGGSRSLSIDEILNYAGRDQLPAKEEFAEDGAVILYEDIKTQFFLDGNWDLSRTQTYHVVLQYFNDKAEEYLTRTIYLDKDRILRHFSACTRKPDGTVIELTKEDLYPTQVQEDFIEFTNNSSVKFTFPGVEPGAILEYRYEVRIFERFSLNDQWYIQISLPKLYSRYSVQIPVIMLENKINWNYSPVNVVMDAPQRVKDLVNERSTKDRNYTYYWELRNIPALDYEPNMPPYDDVAKYAILGIQRENWNKLTEIYWKAIKDRFSINDKDVLALANSIIGDASDDYTKIEKIFHYTQRNYRYVAIDIDDSGYIPNYPQDIINRKYGDCKDMTVLNVALLKALGFEAYPALVKTKSSGTVKTGIVQMDFNHMIAYVKDNSGTEYWLDATGSSCPLNEIYSSIEGVDALVIKDDGTSFFKQMPASKCSDNLVSRNIAMTIGENGSVSGHATLFLKGNENLSFRSSLKDATEKDMRRVMESYVNSNTPGIKITNLQYDDPGTIADTIKIDFDFEHQNYGTMTSDLVILNPFLFTNEIELDRYRDEERVFPIIFNAPTQVDDIVEISFDNDMYRFESTDGNFVKRYQFGSVHCSTKNTDDNLLKFTRKKKFTKTKIRPELYQDFRDYLKDINKVNRINLVLKKTIS